MPNFISRWEFGLKRWVGPTEVFETSSGRVGRSWMQAGCSALELPAVLHLVDRIQRLLAAYRLWLHELRGRLDIAFICEAGSA